MRKLEGVEATADRSNPQRIEIVVDKIYEHAEVSGFAPSAGVWWYRVELPPARRELSDIAVRAWPQGDPAGFELAIVDGDEVRRAPQPAGSWKQELVFPQTQELPSSLLVRLTTARAGEFTLEATRIQREIEVVPCDPEHIDASNPACDGVYPKCKLNQPDFNNPNCCQAETCNLVHGCRARVTYDPGKAKGMSRMAIGTVEGIMRGARGSLYQRGQYVSDILVWHVKAGESLFEIDDPKKVDRAIMLDEKQTWVIVRQPYECRANVRRVDPAPAPP
jgi:hypothetical protein